MNRRFRRDKRGSGPPRAQSAALLAQADRLDRLTVSLFRQAAGLYDIGRLTEGARLVRVLLSLAPAHADGLHLFGVIVCRTGRAALAVRLIERAIMMDQAAAEYQASLGAVYRAQNDLDAAAACYKRALVCNPGYCGALYNLGNAFKDQGRWGEAAVRYGRALVIKPDFPEVRCNFGLLLYSQGKLNEAAAHYQTALVVNPDNPDALSNLGNTLHRLRHRDEAIIHYERALAIHPAHADALHNLSSAQFICGKMKDAVQNCLQALASDGISVDGSRRSNLLVENVLSGIPLDYFCTAARARHLEHLVFLDLHQHSVHQWPDILKRVLRFNLPPMTRFNLLINQAIGQWAGGDLDNLPAVLAAAEMQSGYIGSCATPNFRNYARYGNFIKALVGHSRNVVGPKPEKPIIVAIGDSHCLSYAQSVLEIDGYAYKVQAELIMGAKAWHFAARSYNRYKWRFEQLVAKLPPFSHIIFLFGEIDCRLDEGILRYFRKNGGDLKRIICNVVKDYLSYVYRHVYSRGQIPLFVGVPAPNIDEQNYPLSNSDAEDRLLIIDIVRSFNACLRMMVESQGHVFIDIYSITSSPDGKSTGTLHIDSVHLKPEALALALGMPMRRSASPATD
jgi:tetratricopeptide (TPR) repeat protein